MITISSVIRRKKRNDAGKSNAGGATTPIRMSGTSPQTLSSHRPDDELGDANGRTGHDWLYPDNPRGRFDVGVVYGDRLQDFANSHLSEGPGPGRIPRQWNNRTSGKVGRGITGNPDGDDFFADTTSGDSAGGIGDMQYVPHTPTPRGSVVARPYLRTVDDFAPIPGVYVADATRR